MGDLSENFSRYEFKCKCGKCDCDTVDYALLNVLESVRTHFGARVDVGSAHRCKSHNDYVGGAKNSQHTFGRAADITVDGVDPIHVYSYLLGRFPDVSLGRYPSFTHIDTRTDGPKRW